MTLCVGTDKMEERLCVVVVQYMSAGILDTICTLTLRRCQSFSTQELSDWFRVTYPVFSLRDGVVFQLIGPVSYSTGCIRRMTTRLEEKSAETWVRMTPLERCTR